MSTRDTQSLIPTGDGQGKYSNYTAQLLKVYKGLQQKPMTMKEADVCTGVMRESICSHIATLLKYGKIAVIRKRKCSITGYPHVNEYTADKSLYPQSNQLKMF